MVSKAAPEAAEESSRTAPCEAAEIKELVARILDSPIFVRAPRMRHFLAFLVEETLAGRASQLKEYTLATGVFGKPADFEPGSTSLVRVEAGRLRRLLLQYRVEHGGTDAIVLEVPKGSYVPSFRRVDQPVRTDAQDHPSGHTSDSPSAVTSAGSWSATDERRLITVLSCALGSERGRSAHGTAAEFASAFDVFHERCTTVAQRHGGFVDGGASDRLIVYFGWPQALEDAAGRALTAALEMLAAVREAFGAEPLGVRIAVATSEVVIRAAGPEMSSRPAVIGEAPLLATQILPLVPLNGVLVAESSRRLTGSSFDFIPAGSLDGRAEQANLLWRLLRARPALTRFNAAHAEQFGAIIGRREEEALLMSRWNLSLQGEGQAAVIVGDAGIGKSRLAEAVLERIGTRGAQLRLQCSPHHSNSTLYPCIELIRSYMGAGVGVELPHARLMRSLRARFGLHETLDRALLGALLSGTMSEPLSSLSASQRKDLTLQLLARLLAVQVRRQPSVLLVEDVHWADPTTLELLQDILRRVERLTLFVLLTSRQDPPATLAQRPNLTSIRLARLPKKECNALIDRISSAARLSPLARATILDKAEGVPLFLEELTKLFLAADERALRGTAIPESISDLLASQLDKLGPTRGVAQAAAVIGRQFSRAMLAQACGCPEAETDTALDQLVAAGVIVRDGAEISDGFCFRHALLRDAAYGSMLEHTRRALHGRVGRLLLDSFPEYAEEHPEVIAGHMTAAARHAEATPFWIAAGRKAAGRYALAEAAADLRLALESCAHLVESPRRRECELEGLIELGWVIRHARGYGDPELATIYQRVRELATGLDKPQQLANAVYGLWTHAAGRGRWKTALSLAMEFEALARGMSDSQLEAEAFRLLGASAAFRGEFALARRHFERVLSVYDSRVHGPRFGFDPGAASAAYMAWTLWHLGERELARSYGARALTIAEEKNHASTLAMVLSWLIFYEICEDNVEAVIAYNERLQAVCAERDCRYWQPFGAACAEWACFRQDGDARHLERLLEAARSFRERYLTSCLLLLGARLCGRIDRSEQGLEIASAARRFIEDTDERVWEAECSRVTAGLLLQSSKSNRQGARQWLLRALETAQAQGARSLAQRASADLEALDSTAD